MRRKSISLGMGVALFASPALAHVGDHGEHGIAHIMSEHGLAIGLVTVAIIAAGSIVFMKRKG